jgi:PAS domain S-box-containing protein
MAGRVSRPAATKEGEVSVLIVEVNPERAALVARVLNSSVGEWSSRCVGSLEEVRQHLAEQPWDLLMLNLNLPDSQGLETLQRVREMAPGAAIVVMTGEVEGDMAQRASRAGAQDFLTEGSLTGAVMPRVARCAVERIKAELQVRQSRQILASTLDALPACIAILDGDGSIRAASARWVRYDNPGNPLIHGCSVGTNYLAACGRLVPTGGELFSVAAGLLEVIAGEKDRFNADYSVPSMTGTAGYELSATRFTGPEGTPTVVISHADVSERKELEARLRGSEELFSIILDNVVDLMTIVDVSGKRLYSSPSYDTGLGYAPEEMRRLSSIDLLHPEDTGRIKASLNALFSTGTTNLLEYRLRHKDGRYLHFESRGSLIATHGEGPPRALIVARDVTERKNAERDKVQMEMQLRQAQKLEAIGQLAAGIAHEINTPIQYIGDNAIFLRDAVQGLLDFADAASECVTRQPASAEASHLQGPLRELDLGYLKDEMPRAFQQSLEGVGRVSKIVSAMKDFSHPSGESKEAIDLNRVIESTTTVSHNAWKYVAEMELDLDPTLPLVPCFPGEFNQVILNLIVNAAHAIEESRAARESEPMGRIRIRTRRSDTVAEIRITDTGTGIPESIRGRIFDPFFTTKPVGKGTGQGLSIAHAVIVDKHGGRIAVESVVGRGTTFIVELPLGAWV